MTIAASSYIPTGGAAATRNADVLPLPFPARPQAMTIYSRHVEGGTILTTSARLWHVGASDNSDPRLLVSESSGFYGLVHDNGATNVSAQLAAAPSIGQIVELLAQLNADGSVKLAQSLDGASPSETATSSAAVLGAAWSAALLWPNSRGTSDVGFSQFRNLLFHRDVQTLATMRRLANVI